MSSNANLSAKLRWKVACCVPGCATRFHKSKTTFHVFPKPGRRLVNIKNSCDKVEEIDLHEAWKKALHIEEISPCSRVCSLHFNKDDYFCPERQCRRRRLKQNAIPFCTSPPTSQEQLERVENAEIKVEKMDLDTEGIAENVDRIKQEIEEVPEPVMEDTLKEEVDDPNPISMIIKEELDCDTYNETKVLPDVRQAQPEPQILQPVHQLPQVLMQDIEVQVETDLVMSKFIDFIRNDDELNTATGIQSFQVLDKIVALVTAKFHDKLQHHNTKMSIRDKIILTYVKLKQNFSYSFLAVLFQCYGEKHCREVFRQMITMLNDCLKSAIDWSSREMISHNLPECFVGLEDTRVVIDYVEITTKHPKNLSCQIITDAACKRSQSVKFMVGATPSGNISYISKAYGGGASDLGIFEESDISSLLEQGDRVMVNKLTIDESCDTNGWKCYRPILPERNALSTEEAPTYNVAKARSRVERSNKRIKTFKIVSDKLSTNLIPHVEHIFTVICATMNLGSPMIKEEKLIDS